MLHPIHGCGLTGEKGKLNNGYGCGKGMLDKDVETDDYMWIKR